MHTSSSWFWGSGDIGGRLVEPFQHAGSQYNKPIFHQKWELMRMVTNLQA